MNANSSSSVVLAVGFVVFLCIWVAAMYSWMQVMKHPRADLRWWSPIWSTKDVEPAGHLYFRRFIILMVAGVMTVLAVIALEAAMRSS